MKELSEYKNEIFRRSDEKKRQLKKRRRIAMGVGIPLCLCCVLTVTMLPERLAKGDFAPNMEVICDNAVSEDMETTMQAFYITDPEQVEQVLLLLEEDQLPQKEEDNKNAIADQVMPGSYRLTLELSDGSVLVYRITDDQLYCETTAEHKTLTQAQAESLLDMLNVSVRNDDANKHRFVARVLECGKNWVLVEPLEGEAERNSCDRISFGTQNLENIGVGVGSEIEIVYTGEIMETYPAQIRPISWRLV